MNKRSNGFPVGTTRRPGPWARTPPPIKLIMVLANIFQPALIDRRIYARVSTLRSAFTGEVEEHQKVCGAE